MLGKGDPLFFIHQELTQGDGYMLIAAFVYASILAPWMWVKAIDVIGADSSAMFMNLLPVITIVLAATWLGEEINQYHIIGGAMVISGVVLAQLKRKPKLGSPLSLQN